MNTTYMCTALIESVLKIFKGRVPKITIINLQEGLTHIFHITMPYNRVVRTLTLGFLGLLFSLLGLSITISSSFRNLSNEGLETWSGIAAA